MPSEQRTTVLADILLQLAARPGVHAYDQGLFEVLAEETMRAIYSNFDSIFSGAKTPIDHFAHMGEPFYKLFRDLKPKYEEVQYKLSFWEKQRASTEVVTSEFLVCFYLVICEACCWHS